MDKQFIDILCDVLKQYPEFSQKNEREMRNTLQAMSYRLYSDTHKVDTLTMIQLYCTMNGVKVRKDIYPKKCLVRYKPY